jgi:hypothetical protein
VLLVAGWHPISKKGDVNISVSNEKGLHDRNLPRTLMRPRKSSNLLPSHRTTALVGKMYHRRAKAITSMQPLGRNGLHQCCNLYCCKIREGIRYRIR